MFLCILENKNLFNSFLIITAMFLHKKMNKPTNFYIKIGILISSKLGSYRFIKIHKYKLLRVVSKTNPTL